LSQNTAVDGQKYPSYVWYLHLWLYDEGDGKLLAKQIV
jgi:hypothetical protein